MTTPIIETERLILRPHRADDYDALVALWTDPATFRFIGGRAQSPQEIWFRLMRYAGMWALLGYGFWAFEEKASGQYVGEGGLMDARRGIAGLDGVPEIGWALTPQAGGKGYASEAVAAITLWADEALGAPRTACIIEPANGASIRVAEKNGYRPVGQARMGEAELILMERRRP